MVVVCNQWHSQHLLLPKQQVEGLSTSLFQLCADIHRVLQVHLHQVLVENIPRSKYTQGGYMQKFPKSI